MTSLQATDHDGEELTMARENTGFLAALDDRVCLTPGATYRTLLGGTSVLILVELPAPLGIDKDEARLLDDAIHDAMEQVLAPYFPLGGVGA